jgi:DNA invertase Pin-like site-specific DNA recombinase
MDTIKRSWNEAIAYRRVSTGKQGESGVGLEGQMAAIETYASLDGLQVVDTFEDVGTGRGRRNLVDRPGLQAALEIAKATGRPIIVSGLDRVSREMKTVDEIVRQHGITIISAGDGEMRNPVIIASRAARAQREGELISERTSNALARKKAEGVILGNRKNLEEAQRLGREKRKLLSEETTQQIVAVLDDLQGENLTALSLADILNQRGVRTSTKRSWTTAALRRPLARARQFITQREKTADHNNRHPLYGRF